MSWNYRIIYYDDDDVHPYYGLHEVFYSKKGKIKFWTKEPELVGESEDDIRDQLDMMLKDTKYRKILIHSEIDAK